MLSEKLATRSSQKPGELQLSPLAIPNTKSMLGVALAGQRKYAEAEPFLLDGYNGLASNDDSVQQKIKPSLVDAIDRIEKLYAAGYRWKAQ